MADLNRNRKENSTTPILSVEIDQSEIRRLCHERIAELIKDVDAEYVFWDSKELKRRTCLSWNTIQEQFFFDPRFPKYKVGSKWMFPVKDTREFLLLWLSEQPRA